jgi:nitrite reductase (NADH) large subunit
MDKRLFKCNICGYIHEGIEPPQECPICGATSENFEIEKPLVAEEVPNSFRCLNCEYIHSGDEAPETCPVCGFTKEHFQPIREVITDYGEIDDLKVLIIGGGIAALSAAETLREHSDKVEITMVTNEEKLPYYRLNLTRYLADDISESNLCIHPQYWYDEKNIKIYKKRVVIDILPELKKVILSDNTELNYDKLIVAIGAHPFIPPIEGVSSKGVMTLRSIEDANELLSSMDQDKKVLIIGGGVLGLEAAGAMGSKGLKVFVAEGLPWLMPRQLNEEAASYVADSLGELGVQVEYGYQTEEIIETKEGLKVVSKDGRIIEVDNVVITTGVRPNTYLARKAGLEVNRGLIIDNYMRTSDLDIYAAGDITEHYGVTYGLWNIAQYQGKIAALNVIGNRIPFGGVPRSNALKVLDIDLFSIGEIAITDGSYTTLKQVGKESYLFFLIRDQQVIGSIAIGYKSMTHKIKQLVEKRQSLSPDQVSDISKLIELLN